VNCFSHCIHPQCTCSKNYYQCVSGACVSYDKMCNGEVDCPRGEDEHDCVMQPKLSYKMSPS
jgi:hypothetical protein